jgi:hypothetical protein
MPDNWLFSGISEPKSEEVRRKWGKIQTDEHNNVHASFHFYSSHCVRTAEKGEAQKKCPVCHMDSHRKLKPYTALQAVCARHQLALTPFTLTVTALGKNSCLYAYTARNHIKTIDSYLHLRLRQF